MGKSKKWLFLIALTIIIHTACGQTVSWAFDAVKIGPRTYEIHLKPSVPSPWHIYSQTSPKGGALATKISFNKNPLMVLDGPTSEVGKVTAKYESAFGVTVKYFEDGVKFIQRVKLKSDVKTNVTGTIQYMICTDSRCLAPTKQTFSIAID
ncbi:MAG: cytochrome c-type biosis protein DsbD, protein-disulfide reductase [Chitinophagaceae bacterium]|nr:cytochrome c-type biosis protein DsbD, protein-disulfide reductase [Chitinophagaceae bacterium]